MAELVQWLERSWQILIEPHQCPAPRLIGQPRRQHRRGKYKMLDLGKIQNREEVAARRSGDNPEKHHYDWVKGRLVATTEPVKPVSTYDDWSARWKVASHAYAMAMVLPWHVTDGHKRRVVRQA